MSSDELSGSEIDALLSPVEGNEESASEESPREVLSADEVDDLLNAIEDGAEAEQEDESSTGPMIKIYDYIRPEVLTKSALRDIHLRIENMLSDAVERISSRSGSDFIFKIDSIDMLSLDELIRSIPNPCYGIKIVLESGKFLFLEAESSLISSLGNIFLGLPADTIIGKNWNSINADLFNSIVEILYPGAAADAPVFISVKDPYSISPESLLEPVLTVSITAGDGRLNLVLPLTALIEVFPDIMMNFRLPCLPKEKWIPQKAENAPDLWFKRQYTFPIYHASFNNMKMVFEAGSLPLDPGLRGRVGYKLN